MTKHRKIKLALIARMEVFMNYNTYNYPEYRVVQIDETTPETVTNALYTPAFLRQHIGKLVRVEFLIGTTYLDDRTGILVEVGASYIVLRSIQDSNLLYCDIYSIKFVTISENPFLYNMDFQV